MDISHLYSQKIIEIEEKLPDQVKETLKIIGSTEVELPLSEIQNISTNVQLMSIRSA